MQVWISPDLWFVELLNLWTPFLNLDTLLRGKHSTIQLYYKAWLKLFDLPWQGWIAICWQTPSKRKLPKCLFLKNTQRFQYWSYGSNLEWRQSRNHDSPGNIKPICIKDMTVVAMLFVILMMYAFLMMKAQSKFSWWSHKQFHCIVCIGLDLNNLAGTWFLLFSLS